MRRDLGELDAQLFDVVVIGGGMFGAAAALEGARRGLRVALLERSDYCGATSAHSFKMIHGGIRYIQHADLVRIRQSARARATFLRMAPHLIKPLPIVVPTYGAGMRSKPILRVGMGLYDAITWDRNRGIGDETRRIPAGRFLSRDEVMSTYPGLPESGLTGAGVFCDGQMYNPARLVLAFIRSAVDAGAVCANYVEAVGTLGDDHRVTGVRAIDRLTGTPIAVRGKVVINAAGPYAETFLGRARGRGLTPRTPFSRDAYLVVRRSLLEGSRALTVPAATQDPDAILSRGGRHLFIVPWRGATLIGVWHRVYDGDPDRYGIEEAEIEAWLAEVNGAYRGLDLTPDDVVLGSAGLVPFGENDPLSPDLKFAHRSRVVDHARESGMDGLITLIGVRYTTGPNEAWQVIDLAQRKLGQTVRRSRAESDPVDGGDVDDFQALVREITVSLPAGCKNAATALAHNYGSAWRRVTDLLEERPSLASILPGTTTTAAEVALAVKDEMAVSLCDVLFRRTDLCTTGLPDRRALVEAAAVAGKVAGWSTGRIAAELAYVEDRLRLARSGRALLADGLSPDLAAAA